MSNLDYEYYFEECIEQDVVPKTIEEFKDEKARRTDY